MRRLDWIASPSARSVYGGRCPCCSLSSDCPWQGASWTRQIEALAESTAGASSFLVVIGSTRRPARIELVLVRSGPKSRCCREVESGSLVERERPILTESRGHRRGTASLASVA